MFVDDKEGNTVTVKCNKCSKTVVLKGTKDQRATHGAAMEKAYPLGWKFVNAATQFCPDHAPAKKVRAEKPVKKAAGKAAAKKK